jgi:hypothetical protein
LLFFAADHGAEKFSWPDGGTEPFRGEKGTTGKVDSASPVWPGGRVSSSRVRSSTASPAQVVGQFLQSFIEFPQRQKSSAINVNIAQVLDKMRKKVTDALCVKNIHRDGPTQKLARRPCRERETACRNEGADICTSGTFGSPSSRISWWTSSQTSSCHPSRGEMIIDIRKD